MNTFALLSTPNRLKDADPEILGGSDALNSCTGLRELPQAVLTSGGGAVKKILSKAVGGHLICRRTVVRWYHGGINE